jgi:hypothetical protein
MARTTLADYREFIRVSVDLPLNPKLAMIDDPAAGWAYVVSLCYCGQNLTDGSFPMPVLLRLAGVKPAVARALVKAGLWHDTGHSCGRCPQPISGMGVVHDYLAHQRSSGEAKSLRDARREAGRKGAASRWSGNGDGTSHSNSHSNGVPTGESEPWQLDGMPMPEVEVEVEKELKKKTSSSSRKKPEIHLPASWHPNDAHRLRASAAQLNLDVQVQLFKAHAEEHDRRAASWNGAFTRWLINAEDYQRRTGRPALRLASGSNYRGPHQGPVNEADYDKPMYAEEQQ